MLSGYHDSQGLVAIQVQDRENTTLERELSVQISIDLEFVEIKSLFFIDGTLDSIIIYNMKNDE